MRSSNVNYGLNADRELDDYVRCARCGFPCRLSRDTQAQDGSKIGWGIKNTAFEACGLTYDDGNTNYENVVNDYEEIIPYDKADADYDSGQTADSQINYNGVARTIYDPVVTNGCPNCGTLLYR